MKMCLNSFMYTKCISNNNDSIVVTKLIALIHVLCIRLENSILDFKISLNFRIGKLHSLFELFSMVVLFVMSTIKSEKGICCIDI